MYDKLVRDKIPEIIRQNDEEPITHTADDKEYDQRLREKLVEEAVEFEENGDIEELADVLEVIDAIINSQDTTREEIEKIQEDKAKSRGRFEDKVVLDDVNADS